MKETNMKNYKSVISQFLLALIVSTQLIHNFIVTF